MKTPREVEDLQMALRAVDYQLQTHPNDISLLSEKTGLLRALNTETTIDPKTAQEIEDLETALRTVDYELGEYPRDSSLLAEKVRLLKATSVELACEVPEVKPAVKPPAAETAVSRPSPIGDTTETDGKRQYLRDRENSYLPELTLFTPSAVARLVAAALLVLALGRLPYGFYQLLRLVVCGVSAYSLDVVARADCLALQSVCAALSELCRLASH